MNILKKNIIFCNKNILFNNSIMSLKTLNWTCHLTLNWTSSVSCSVFCLWITLFSYLVYTTVPRIIQVGSDIRRSLVKSPAQSMGNYDIRPGCSELYWAEPWKSKLGVCTTSLGNLFQFWTDCTVETFFLISSRNISCINLCLLIQIDSNRLKILSKDNKICLWLENFILNEINLFCSLYCLNCLAAVLGNNVLCYIIAHGQISRTLAYWKII